MKKVIKESRYFLTWFVFWISSVIGGFVLGAIGGGITGAVLGAAGVDLDTIKIVCGAVGFILSIPLSYVLFRVFVGSMIVSKVHATVQSMMQAAPNHAMEDIGA